MPDSTTSSCPRCGTPADAFRAGLCPRCVLAAELLTEDPELEPGSVPGYRLRGKIGEGGMGEVFLAEQTKPVMREVALKRLKHAADALWLPRFTHEMEALGLLAHRHIARVLDAGVADDGRPFYTMELVDGAPLTCFCDRHRLSVARRVELMRQVCEAVDHAHRRGVWHGDLKPANILAAMAEDGTIELKLIDFGLHRAWSAGPSPDAMFTPEYASPEALAGGARDSRSDVYSLGAVLRELTGGGCDGIVPPEAAAARRTTPRALTRLLRGDLRCIVNRAMAADASDRYASAAEMADDAGRWLAGWPVRAHPPSVAYLLNKFARRHRRRLTAGAVAVMAIAAAGAAAALHRITAARSRAALERTMVEAERARHRSMLLRDFARSLAMIARSPDPSMRDHALEQLAGRMRGEAERVATDDAGTAVAILSALAEAARVLDRPELAIAQWRRALEWLPAHDPQRIAVEGALAQSLMAAGEPEAAADQLRAIADSPRLQTMEPPQQAELFLSMTRAQFALREFSAAAEHARSAMAAAGTDAGSDSLPVLHAALLLGQCLTELRRYDEAHPFLQQAAAALPPGSPLQTEAATWLGEVEAVLRDQRGE